MMQKFIIKAHKSYSIIRYIKKFSTKTSTPWKTVVGLEIHAQISSKSKLFSGASHEFGALVNDRVALFDAAIPGTLPVLNRRCVEAAVLTALALSCKINAISSFDRKHYFYADLPAGYQITQQRAPIAQDGILQFEVFNPRVHKKPYKKSCQIKQIQLEQDSGKSLHDSQIGQSLIDLNRAGAPLIELVFEPELEDGEEAAALVNELMLILERLNSCNCRMEEGALRIDANVSVNLPNEPLGIRTEIKNIGSVRGVANAIKYEAYRQILIIEKGGNIINETRSWDPENNKTISLRDKEVTQDYRYMPEPNLPPLYLNLVDDVDQNNICVPFLKTQLPELPNETRQRLMSEYGLTREHAIRLVNENKLLNYFFDLTQDKSKPVKPIINILLNELLTVLNENNILINDCKLNSKDIGQIIDCKTKEEINLPTVKRIFNEILNGNNKSIKEIIDTNGWKQINDESEIEKICIKVINDNASLVEACKKGKKRAIRNLNNIVFQISDEKINMTLAVAIMEELLKK